MNNDTTKLNNNQDFELELYLSSDGKHTVHVKTYTDDQRERALPYAKKLYQKILEEFGTKQEQAVKAYGGNGKTEEKKEESKSECGHKLFSIKESKSEKNPGRLFKQCNTCKEFLGWQS